MIQETHSAGRGVAFCEAKTHPFLASRGTYPAAIALHNLGHNSHWKNSKAGTAMVADTQETMEV